MYRLNQDFSIPEAELACDDVLLDLAERGETGECFRLWEAKDTFVVLGRGNTYKTEVDLEQCKADGVSIFRRHSGGGTILQKPGVLNCTLILDMEARPELKFISKSNCVIMSWFKAAFDAHLEGVSVRGYSDLCILDKKVMGTAQRRYRRFVLFHGSLLVACDLSLISKYLSHPSKEPGYREGRGHLDFLTTLPFSVSDVSSILSKHFVCEKELENIDVQLVNEKVQTFYGSAEWNFKL